LVQLRRQRLAKRFRSYAKAVSRPNSASGLGVPKTWIAFNAVEAVIAEGIIGIMCACAPSLRRCFGQYFKDHSTTGDSRGMEQDGSAGLKLDTSQSKLRNGPHSRLSLIASSELVSETKGNQSMEAFGSHQWDRAAYIESDSVSRLPTYTLSASELESKW
jgi:hypothetical protein